MKNDLFDRFQERNKLAGIDPFMDASTPVSLPKSKKSPKALESKQPATPIVNNSQPDAVGKLSKPSKPGKGFANVKGVKAMWNVTSPLGKAGIIGAGTAAALGIGKMVFGND
jgi:hypothetical protein